MLHRFGTDTARYLFPLSGMISLTVPTPDGGNVEVALVGREGMAGISQLLGRPSADLQAISQVRGEAIAVAVEGLSVEEHAALGKAAEAYAATLLFELAQTAACNRLHSVEERTARWLLHAADRAQTTDLQLTHEFLAMMLGVRRASVTVVVGKFEAAGMIVAGRRQISLANRAAPLACACNCYEVMRSAASTGNASGAE